MLAAGADHDVSKVRAELPAHTRALNALRETRFATLNIGMAEITALLERHDPPTRTFCGSSLQSATVGRVD